jgi:hypothetical protein
MSPGNPPGVGVICSARYFGIIAMHADAANISDPDHSPSYYHDNKITRQIKFVAIAEPVQATVIALLGISSRNSSDLTTGTARATPDPIYK